MTSPRQWWRRAAAAAKDKRSIYLIHMASVRHRVSGSGGGTASSNPEMEAAVIRATNHDDRSVDYKNAARVFAWSRTSDSFLQPLMWVLARRVGRTRSWAVALKCLMLAHGLLLRSDVAPPPQRLGRLPFDLSDFRDRSSSQAKAFGFSAFVRAYFLYLDHRSLLSALTDDFAAVEAGDNDDARLDRIQKLQILLDLSMQIRPYADGMAVGLVLEAMDCVVIEIFEVYSQICNGIACFLVEILGSSSSAKTTRTGKAEKEARRRRGLVGMRILRKATEQSSHLSSYFELCRTLGVLNATEFPAVETIPEEDIRDLERLVMEDMPEIAWEEEASKKGLMDRAAVTDEESGLSKAVVMAKEWVVFDDEPAGKQGLSGDPFFASPAVMWAAMVSPTGAPPFGSNGNLIELI